MGPKDSASASGSAGDGPNAAQKEGARPRPAVITRRLSTGVLVPATRSVSTLTPGAPDHPRTSGGDTVAPAAEPAAPDRHSHTDSSVQSVTAPAPTLAYSEDLKELDRVVLSEHGGPQIAFLVASVRSSKPDANWALVRQNGHLSSKRCQHSTLLAARFEKEGLRDEWLIAAICLHDRLLMSANSMCRPFRANMAALFALALTALKLGGAEIELDRGLQETLLALARKDKDNRDWWKEVVRTELASLRSLDYTLATPTPWDFCQRLIPDLVLESKTLGHGSWKGFEIYNQPSATEISRGLCPERNALSDKLPVPIVSVSHRFGMLAFFLIELGLLHAPKESYSVEPMPLGLALAALRVSMEALGVPVALMRDLSGTFGHYEQMLGRKNYDGDGTGLNQLADALRHHWSRPGTSSVSRWRQRCHRFGWDFPDGPGEAVDISSEQSQTVCQANPAPVHTAIQAVQAHLSETTPDPKSKKRTAVEVVAETPEDSIKLPGPTGLKPRCLELEKQGIKDGEPAKAMDICEDSATAASVALPPNPKIARRISRKMSTAAKEEVSTKVVQPDPHLLDLERSRMDMESKFSKCREEIEKDFVQASEALTAEDFKVAEATIELERQSMIAADEDALRVRSEELAAEQEEMAEELRRAEELEQLALAARARARALERKRPRLQGNEGMAETELKRAQSKIAAGQALVGSAKLPFGRPLRCHDSASTTPSIEEPMNSAKESSQSGIADTNVAPASAPAAAPAAAPDPGIVTAVDNSSSCPITLVHQVSPSNSVRSRRSETMQKIEVSIPVLEPSARLSRAPSRTTSTPTMSPTSMVGPSPAPMQLVETVQQVPVAKRAPRRSRAVSTADAQSLTVATSSAPASASAPARWPASTRRSVASSRQATRALQQEPVPPLSVSSTPFPSPPAPPFGSPQLPVLSMDTSSTGTSCSSRRRLMRDFSSTSHSSYDGHGIPTPVRETSQPAQASTMGTGHGHLQPMTGVVNPASFSMRCHPLVQQIPFTCTAPANMGLATAPGGMQIATMAYIPAGHQGAMHHPMAGPQGAVHMPGQPQVLTRNQHQLLPYMMPCHQAMTNHMYNSAQSMAVGSSPARKKLRLVGGGVPAYGASQTQSLGLQMDQAAMLRNQAMEQPVVPASVAMLRNVFDESQFSGFSQSQAQQQQLAAAVRQAAPKRPRGGRRAPAVEAIDCDAEVTPGNPGLAAVKIGGYTMRPRGGRGTRG